MLPLSKGARACACVCGESFGACCVDTLTHGQAAPLPPVAPRRGKAVCRGTEQKAHRNVTDASRNLSC